MSFFYDKNLVLREQQKKRKEIVYYLEMSTELHESISKII